MAIMKFNIRAGLLGLVVATAALSSQQSDAPGVLVADALRLSSLMRAPTAATNSSEDTCNKILSTAGESGNKVIEDKQSLEFVLMESLLMSRFDEYWRGKFVNDTHPDVDRPQLMKDNYYSKARTAFLEKNISLACSIGISLEKSYREFDDIWRGMFDQDSIDRLNAFDSMRVKKAHVEAKNAWVIGDGDYANAILTSMLDEVERLRHEREAALTSQQRDAPDVLVSDALSLRSLMRAPKTPAAGQEGVCLQVLGGAPADGMLDKDRELRDNYYWVLEDSRRIAVFDEYWKGVFGYYDTELLELEHMKNTKLNARDAYLRVSNLKSAGEGACEVGMSGKTQLDGGLADFDIMWNNVFHDVTFPDDIDLELLGRESSSAKSIFVMGYRGDAARILVDLADQTHDDKVSKAFEITLPRHEGQGIYTNARGHDEREAQRDHFHGTRGAEQYQARLDEIAGKFENRLSCGSTRTVGAVRVR